MTPTLRSSGSQKGCALLPPLSSNVSLRCRNSMQGIRFVAAERHGCTRVGATSAPARDVHPAAAGERPARHGLSHRVHRAFIYRQTQQRSRFVTLIRAKAESLCRARIATVRSCSSIRYYRRPRPVATVCGSAWLVRGVPAPATLWHPYRSLPAQ